MSVRGDIYGSAQSILKRQGTDRSNRGVERNGSPNRQGSQNDIQRKLNKDDRYSSSMKASSGDQFRNKFENVSIRKSSTIDRRGTGTYSDYNSTQRTDF